VTLGVVAGFCVVLGGEGFGVVLGGGGLAVVVSGGRYVGG
jgi:hypothetical protein